MNNNVSRKRFRSFTTREATELSGGLPTAYGLSGGLGDLPHTNLVMYPKYRLTWYRSTYDNSAIFKRKAVGSGARVVRSGLMGFSDMFWGNQIIKSIPHGTPPLII